MATPLCATPDCAFARLSLGAVSLEERSTAFHTASMNQAHIDCSRHHTLATELVCHVNEECMRVSYACVKARATLLKA